MKFEKIFLICVFILILSVSAVSAADENQTQDVSPLASQSEADALGGIDDYEIDYSENNVLRNGDNTLFIMFPSDATGSADITIDGKTTKHKITENGVIHIDYSDFTLGLKNITIKYNGDEKFNPKTVQGTFDIRPGVLPANYNDNLDYNNAYYTVCVPENTNGNFTYSIDGGVEKTVPIKSRTTKVTLDEQKLGNHYLNWKLNASGQVYSSYSSFNAIPAINFDYYSYAWIKDDNYLIVNLPSNVSGQLSVSLGNGKVIYNKSGVNGEIRIPINEYLIVEDTVAFLISYTDEAYNYDGICSIEAREDPSLWNMNISFPNKVFYDTGEYKLDINNWVNLLDSSYFSLYIDGKKQDFIREGDSFIFRPSKFSLSSHKIELRYAGDLYHKATNASAEFEAVNFLVDFPEENLVKYHTDFFSVHFPENSKGSVKMYVDNKFKYAYNDMSFGSVAFTVTDVSWGMHTIKVVWTKDGKTIAQASKKLNYTYEISPLYHTMADPNDLIEGGTNNLLYLVYDMTGTLSITIDGTTYKKKITNDIMDFDISKAKAGNYTVRVTYSGDKNYYAQTFTHDIEILPKLYNVNAPNSFYCNEYYQIKVSDLNNNPAKDYALLFDVNGAPYYAITNSNGIAKVKLPLKPGSYSITIRGDNLNVNKKVTVKHVLTLNDVKVKKSAKSLVLTATLKKGNEPIKNKKVTFTFNGKVVGKISTNSKGVAKVTIKSAVLKKLKVGKKVTYHATFGKDTVKKTVKVLK